MKNLNTNFFLIEEMLQTPEIIKNFHTRDLSRPTESLKKTKKLFLSGEGSSRIFPAKNIIYRSLKKSSGLTIHTEGARQSAEVDLSESTLFCASNSGKTKEVIELFGKHPAQSQYALTAYTHTPIGKLSDEEFILNCGKENATVATKSVVEQALFYQTLVAEFHGNRISKESLTKLAEKAQAVLEMEIDNEIISKLSNSPMIYFSGRNNGVAEEITLKTNEIVRKKSDYLEGTYAVHGVEEVMDRDEIVVLIEPFEDELKKIEEVLVRGVGMCVIVISTQDTIFPTIRIPSLADFDEYLQLLTCWNVLVRVGINLGIDLDKPTRARKIGNEG